MRSLPVPDPGTPDHSSPARYLLWLLRTQARTVTWGALLGVVWMLSQALMPAAVGRAIDAGVAGKDVSALLAWAAALLGLGAAQAASGVLRHRMAVCNWLQAAYRTIQVVTRQATRLGGTLPRRITAGEVVSVGNADIDHIGDVLDITSRGTGAVVAIVAVSGLTLSASPELGLIVVAGVPVILALAAPLLRPLNRRQHRHRELVGELNSRATDIVAGLRVLRGVGGERTFAGRYRAESQGVRRAGVEVARAESLLWGAEILLPGLLIALVTWVGARFAAAGRISLGELVAFYGYAVFLIHPMGTIGEAAGKITKALVSARRVVRILDLEPEITLPVGDGPVGDGPVKGGPVGDGPVRYGPGEARPAPGGELIDVASGLVVKPGRLTAIAAADPADARAAADRLGRLAEIPGADVTFGGVPLRDVADVRDRILVAVNEDVLFTGTLRETLGGGDPWPAVVAACVEDVVEAAGLESRVAEAAREFSGGQRQRLRLARALAADPEVLVLVEPTSAVDAHTEARVADRLRPFRDGRTTVVCTTSPLVLDRADHVAYIEDGTVVAEGAHRELLRTDPRYAAAVTRGELEPK